MTVTLCIPGVERDLIRERLDKPTPRREEGQWETVRITAFIDTTLLPKECTYFLQIHAAADAAGMVTGVDRTPAGTLIDEPAGIVEQKIRAYVTEILNGDPDA